MVKIQYTAGSVTVDDTANVVGSGTLWRNNVAVGNFFKIVGDSDFYEVGSVTDDEHFTLTAAYAGTPGAGKSYQVLRDYTENYGLKEIHRGQLDWQIGYNSNLKAIDAKIHELES